MLWPWSVRGVVIRRTAVLAAVAGDSENIVRAEGGQVGEALEVLHYSANGRVPRTREVRRFSMSDIHATMYSLWSREVKASLPLNLSEPALMTLLSTIFGLPEAMRLPLGTIHH